MECIKLFLTFLCFFTCIISSQHKFIIANYSEEAGNLLKKSETYCKEKQWENALQCYERLLLEHRDDYVKVSESLFQNVNYLVCKQILKLPKEIQNTYQTFVEFQLAKDIHHFRQMRYEKFIPQYLYIEEGKNIANFIINQHLAKEEYEKALNILSYFHNKEKIHPSIAQTALCYLGIGNKTLLDNLSKQYNKEKEVSTIKIGKKKSLKIYINELSQKIVTRIKKQNRWHNKGSNINRDFLTSGTFESFLQGWKKNIQGNTLRRWGKRRARRIWNFRSNHPPSLLIANQIIYLIQNSTVYAYNIMTAKQLWYYELPIIRQNYNFLYNENSLYIISQDQSYYKRRSRQRKENIIKIHAISGKVIWEKVHLKKDFVTTGQAVIWGDTIYISTYKRTGLLDYYILAYNKHTGKFLWETFIGSIKNRRYKNKSKDALAGGNGKLYYANNRICVCLNPINGRIAWIRKHISGRVFYQNDSANNPLIITHQKIFFSPLSSQYIYCLAPESGELLYKKEGILYAINGGKGILFLKQRRVRKIRRVRKEIRRMPRKYQRLYIFNLETGKDIHKSRWRNGSIVQHFISNNNYFIFESNGIRKFNLETYQLSCLQPKDGKFQKVQYFTHQTKIECVAKTNEVFAYLSKNILHVFLDNNKIEKNLKKELQKNPNSSITLFKLAKIYEKQNMFNGALKYYKKAIQFESKRKEKKEIQENLSSLYRKLAKNYHKKNLYAKAYEYYKYAFKNTSDINQKIHILFTHLEYSRLIKNEEKFQHYVNLLVKKYGNRIYRDNGKKMIVGIYAFQKLQIFYQSQKQYEKALETNQKMLIHFSHTKYKSAPLWRWGRKINNNIIQKSNKNIYKIYDTLAKLKYERLGNNAKSSQYYQIIQYYPNSKNTEKIYYEMLLVLEKEKGDQLLNHYNTFIDLYPTSSHSIDVYKKLIHYYESNDSYERAKLTIEEILHRYKRHSLSKRQIDFQANILCKLQTKKYKEIYSTQHPQLYYSSSPKLKQLKLTLKHFTFPHYILDIQKPSKSFKEKLFFVHKRYYLYCYKVSTGKLLWQKYFRRLTAIKPIGKYLLVVSYRYRKIYCIKQNTGKIVWKHISRGYSLVKYSKNYIACIAKTGRKTKLITLHTLLGKKWEIEFQGSMRSFHTFSNKCIIRVYEWRKQKTTVYLFDIKQQKLIAKYSPKKTIFSFSMGNQYIALTYRIRRETQIHIFLRHNLQKVLETKFSRRTTLVAIPKDSVIINHNGNIQTLNIDTQEMKTIYSGLGRFTNVTCYEKYIYIRKRAKGIIHDMITGKQVEFKRIRVRENICITQKFLIYANDYSSSIYNRSNLEKKQTFAHKRAQRRFFRFKRKRPIRTSSLRPLIHSQGFMKLSYNSYCWISGG